MALVSKSPQLLWKVKVGPSPWMLAVDSHGNCYVTEQSTMSVIKYDTDGNLITTWGGNGNGDGQFSLPTGITVDSQGNIYVSDGYNTRIEKFDSNGKFLSQWATETGVGPAGVGVDPQGNIYVANHRPHKHFLQKFDANGQLLSA